MNASAEVIRCLKNLQCPPCGSVWLGPFEQLAGAGYALLASHRHGIYRRNLVRYYPRVQTRIASHLENFFSDVVRADVSIPDDWLSGFYFNSAIQRIVWAGECLLLTFAVVDCPCGHRKTEKSVAPERPGWIEVLKGALSRLDHAQNYDKTSLVKCRALREQFIVPDSCGGTRGYRRGDPLDRTKILAMLRYTVNNRKHRVYVRSKLHDQVSAGRGDNKRWCSSGADWQMDLATEAFEIVCAAYQELKNRNSLV
jgi:hypothetical protein